MNILIKNLSPIALLAGTVCLSSAAQASDMNTHTVAIQSEVTADEMPLMTDIIFEAALAEAAAKTLENDKDWFRVTYRDANTQTITRNVSSSAESRYLDLDDGERVELDIPTKDVIVQVQKIDFEMGSGPKPSNPNSFEASKLVLPGS